jgi:murein L,D-transpeptidase YafK
MPGSTLALILFTAASAAAAEPKADLIVVEKSQRTLQLYAHGSLVKSYRVALGGHPVGAKRQRGDEKTPEGEYTIDGHLPNSHYHMALHVSYPNAQDRARAKQAGVDPGDAIMIHGLPNGQGAIGAAHRLHDWTLGCIAVTDREIEEIYKLVPDGTRVVIKP